ncbi:MAG: CotH kinase family protein [Paludibacter sp.]|nr:CotH kinase family protein [Paludibacter sp.]
MKYAYLIIIVILFASCNLIVPPEQQDFNDSITALGTTYIYDIDVIPEIKLEVSTEQWNKLLLDFDTNKNNEEYVKSDFSFTKDGHTISLQDVGIHIRGNTSRRRPEGSTAEVHNSTNPVWHHASFSVNLKKFNNAQRLAGAEKINLKWFKDDAMYVREIYCYDLFERFGVWTAPQSSYCRLSIKIKEDATTAYYGVYEMVEPVDEEFLKNRKDKFADTKGNLWKAAWGADLSNSDKSRMGLENVTLEQTYTPVYDLKTNELQLETAKSQLVDFITNLNNKTDDDFKNWISSKMDIELFLRTYAVNVMCGMWDDYWVNQNNYYFYFDSAGKFYFIPYDYDNTLGTSEIISDSGTQDVLNWGKDTQPLVKKIISIPEYKALYIQYIKELCDSNNDLFQADKSMTRIINWQNKISGFVNNDTNEDTEIIDKPANWGNCDFYRLLETNNNYFKIRAANIPN